MRKLFVGITTILGLAILLSGGRAQAQQLCACVDKNNNKMRAVSDAGYCNKNENFVCWNIEGPAGPPGQDGADGLHCWDLDGNGECNATEDRNGDGQCDALDCQCCVGGEGFVSLNGIALVADQLNISLGTGNELGYLAWGTAYAFKPGDVFSFAPVRLPQGATIKGIECVVKDNSGTGYIDVGLLRGSFDTPDPTDVKVIALAWTSPPSAESDFIKISGTADPSFSEVDNSKYGYFFRVDFLDNPGVVGENLQLQGIIVNYTK